MAERTLESIIELAIEKLTNVSIDLGKMLAVHEQRLNQQEKQMENLEETVEKRREEAEVKLKDVYETIRTEDKNILIEISNLRNEAAFQHEKLTERMIEMEKTIWMYMGGLTALFLFLTYGQNLLKVFLK